MPLDLFEAITPAQLTNYVRGAQERNALRPDPLEEILPATQIDDLEYRFNKGDDSILEAAEYRAYDTESPIGKVNGFREIRGELPPISEKLPLKEYDRLRMRRLADTAPEMRGSVLDLGETLATKLLARVAMAREEALFTGKIVLSENGVTASIDFGRTSSHNATAATVWSTSASATPVVDLINGVALINDAGGDCTDIFMNRATYAEMKLTAEVKNLAAVNGVVPGMVTDSAVSTILESFSLPPITVVNKLVRPKGGSSRQLVQNDRVLLVDRTEVGSTPFGVTAEQLEYSSDGEVKGGGLFVMAWKNPDPVQVTTKASAIAVPVLSNPDLSVGLSV